jgi:septal ring factor EnvC (AmiA/AmiB activator)
MNTTAIIITVSIGFATLIFSIFGASWLNMRQLSLLMEQNEKRETERYTSLEQRISDLEKRIDERFTSLEKRIEDRFASLETRVDRIERQLEQIFKPVLPR